MTHRENCPTKDFNNASCVCNQAEIPLRPPPNKEKCSCGSVQFDYAGRCLACKKEKWEERFEKECMDTSALAGLSGGRKLYVKDLIRKLLASQKAEIVEKLKGMKKYPTEDQEDGLEYDEGYDDALDDIIKSLTEKGDE